MNHDPNVFCIFNLRYTNYVTTFVKSTSLSWRAKCPVISFLRNVPEAALPPPPNHVQITTITTTHPAHHPPIINISIKAAVDRRQATAVIPNTIILIIIIIIIMVCWTSIKRRRHPIRVKGMRSVFVASNISTRLMHIKCIVKLLVLVVCIKRYY